MAERERDALIVAPGVGVLWGAFMAFVAWRFDGAEVVLLQGWIFGGAWLCGWAAGRPLTGAVAGLLLVGTAIWTYEALPGWGYEHHLPPGLQGADRENNIALFDAADIVLWTTHLIGALCGLGGALWAGVTRAHPEPETPLTPPPLPPLPQGTQTPALWAGGDPEALPEPERPVPPEPPALPRDPQLRTQAPRRRIAAAALAVTALGTDAALAALFFTYTDSQEVGAWLFAAAAAVAAAVLGRRYALAALLAGVILACSAAAIQDADYDHHSPFSVIR